MNQSHSITPTNLRDFLKAQGWTLRPEGIADRLYVMENSRFPRRQLVFPMDTTVADYTESVDRVLEKLGEMIGEQPQTLLRKIQTACDDVLRFRVTTGQSGKQALPLDFANTLVTGAQQLLKAAACTVLHPRLYHPHLASTEALQVIERATFSSAETDGFILKISCPIHALDDVQGVLRFDEKNLPFVRRVTLSLKRGIEQLIGAIESGTLDQWVEELKQAETPLVSSNLCEALLRFHDEGLGNALDLSIDWSVLESVASQDRLEKPLRIQQDYFERIEEVRRQLCSVSGHIRDTFIGTVERLCGEMGEDGQRSGEVILALLLQEGETTRAKVLLSVEDYATAGRAHMTEGAYIRVTGQLQQGRPPRFMTELSQFELLLPGTAVIGGNPVSHKGDFASLPLEQNGKLLQVNTKSPLFQELECFTMHSTAAQKREITQVLLSDMEQVLGSDYCDVLRIRNKIAGSIGKMGNPVQALELSKALLLDVERVLGPNHPDTMRNRCNIAYWTGKAGDAVRALKLFEALLSDVKRMLGSDHYSLIRAIQDEIAYWTNQVQATSPP